MGKNFLSYTNLDYDSIKKSLQERLAQDSRFNNFSESSFYAILSEIFSATTDFTNYYIERRAEESYLDTAKLRSSVSLLSKMLGYVIRRPTPATTQIKITIKTLPAGAVVGSQLNIPQFTSFVLGAYNFINPNSLIYNVTQDDITYFASIPNYFKELNYYSTEPGLEGRMFADNEFQETSYMKPITLIQGTPSQYTIPAFSNPLVNTRYQKYTIKDKKFSNIYGSEDFGYDVNTGITTVGSNITRVKIAGNDFVIDRKTLMTNAALSENNNYGDGARNYYCVMKTNLDDGVEISFGDDIISSIGAKNSSDDIVIDYLSTEGSAANQTGVVGRIIDIQMPTLGNFLKSNIEIKLNKNVTGGLDIEDIESVKLNAPGNYSSMDRCVTPKDYISFIKTLFYNSEEIKNAIAWGEQEESKENGVANIKLFNVVLFTFLIDIYKKSNSGYVGIKADDEIGVTLSDNDYFNTIVKSDSTTPLKKSTLTTDKDLLNIYDKLYSRSEISVKNLYISPTIRDFNLVGNVYINPLVDKNSTTTKINNAIYSYLSNNLDFRTPLYISNLIDVVESFSEVKYADISLDSNQLYVDKFVTTTTSDSQDIIDDVPSGAPINSTVWFNDKVVGYVFKSSIVDKESSTLREYSKDLEKTPYDIYVSSLPNIIDTSYYTNETLETIAKVLPQNFLMKLAKIDDTYAEYSLVWNDSYYGVAGFEPSERNLLLGLMKDTYENIVKLIAGLEIKNTSLVDTLVAIGCACNIEKVSDTTTTISSNTQVQLQYFLDNDLINVVDAFRKKFSSDISLNMIDSFGNINNYSMRNEVARVNASNLTYLYQK